MTWGEFKAWMAERGVADDEEIWYIDLQGIMADGPEGLRIERDERMGLSVF